MTFSDFIFIAVTFSVILTAFLIATNWQSIRTYIIGKALDAFWKYIIIRAWWSETKAFFKAHWKHPLTDQEEKELAKNSFDEPLFV